MTDHYRTARYWPVDYKSPSELERLVYEVFITGERPEEDLAPYVLGEIS